MSDPGLQQQKLLLDIYSYLRQIESQLDSIPTASQALIEAKATDLEDTDTYLRLIQPIVNNLRIAALNAKDSLRQYRQIRSASSSDSDTGNTFDEQQSTIVRRYAIAIELNDNSYSSRCLDLPECIAMGDTIESVKQQLKKVIIQRLNQMANNGEAIPEALAIVDYVDVILPKS